MIEKITVVYKDGITLDSNLLEKFMKIFGSKELKFISYKELKKKDLLDVDLVITLGGDGTFVKAGNLIEDSMILGINANPNKSEGALTSININQIDELKRILIGDFEIIKRQRARVILNGKVLSEHALNEVYIGANSQFHSSRYKIKFNEEEEEHRSSGIIVSTGTGSAAWFYSAGGKIFDHDEEKLSFVVREPYFGKRIFTPKILNGEIRKGEKLVVNSTRHSGGIIAINDSIYDFDEGDVVEVELSDKPLKVIKLK